MLLQEMVKFLDTDLTTLMGELKLNLIGNRLVAVQNFKKVFSYSNDKITLLVKNDELIIEGENFKIIEMGVKDIVVSGKINNIYFLKGKQVNNEKV